MRELYDALKHCAERVDRYRQLRQRVGESNTKAGLIEPIIAALGWDVLDPDEVHREYRRRPVDNPVDYALLLLRTHGCSSRRRASAKTSTTRAGPARPSATRPSPGWSGSR